MQTITICGGGSLGHVIAGWLSAKRKAIVNILTNHPSQWHTEIFVETPEGHTLHGKIGRVSDDPFEVVFGSDIVLLCLPGFMISEELKKIKPYLGRQTYVGSVFSSTGFFFEAIKILGKDQPLWGFQRVPFISRVSEYGLSAHLLGYKSSFHVAIEHVDEKAKKAFSLLLQDWFERRVTVLKNYLEASLTNSNPLLHTSRLYTMFGGDKEGMIFPRMIMFYEEWTQEAAELLINMDREFFNLLSVLPVTKNFLPTILEYYESADANSLARKLSSIAGFKGIESPMKLVDGFWVPDYESRYFTEDFPYGLKYIWLLAKEKGIDCPNINMVYKWGADKTGAWHA